MSVNINNNGTLERVASEDTAQIADIVNVYGSKNLIPYPYQQITSSNGITWTDNGDGTITADGTATGNSWVRFAGSTLAPVEIPTPIKQLIGKEVILSSGEDVSGIGIRIDLYDASKTRVLSADTSSVEERKFTIPSNSVYMALQAFVFTGNTASNLKIKPMLRLASIEDDTYVPYVPTNKTLHEEKASWKANGVLGAKNLIPYPYIKTIIGTGITFTDNGDGTVTANGTAGNSEVRYYFTGSVNAIFNAPDGDYILSDGCSVESSSYGVVCAIYNGATYQNVGYHTRNVDGKVRFKLSSSPTRTATALYISISAGTTLNNVVFKPMLRLAEDTDTTYQPYAMTNRELTERVAEGLDTITFVNAQNTNNLTNLVKMGNLRILHIGCNLTSLTPDSATTWIHLITIPDGAKYQARMVGYDSTQNIAVVLRAEGTKIFLSPLAQLSVNDFIVGTLIYEV